MSQAPDDNHTHILVVEDDSSLANWMADYLTDNGYLVSVANRGDVAISLIREDNPALVILDVNLPAGSGFDVCREVRRFTKLPILMLTARSDEDDEVQGLQAGANDYLIKPVRPKALLTRIQTLLTQPTDDTALPGSDTQRISIGTLCIDQESRTVTLDESPIALSTNEFDMLWLLADNAGKVMTREAIIEALRGIEYDGFNRSIDILISRIRKKLNDDSTRPFKVKTVWGKGYLLATDAW